MPRIPVYQPSLNGNEKLYVNECLDSGWISSRGDFVSRFEQAFSDFTGSSYATSVCNGTVALHLALEVLGIGNGDEVIVPTFTYIASVNTIAQTGATPVFIDSLESTWQMDPSDIKQKISPKTKAIMAVHLYGHPCDMESLRSICDDYGIFLIEDCAEAIGSYYKDKHVGTFGDVATFSFFGNKTITTGEGGMLITGNKDIHDQCFHLKNQGVSPSRAYWHDVLGYNYRMTNICAAIGLAQIENIDTILSKKRKIAKIYESELANFPLLFHKESNDVKHSYWMCSITLNDASKRDQLREFLDNNGIETRPFFFPAHIMPVYREDANYPIAESLSERGINLPSYPGLSEKEVLDICVVIKKYFDSTFQ